MTDQANTKGRAFTQFRLTYESTCTKCAHQAVGRLNLCREHLVTAGQRRTRIKR